jgi:hypothetical protein
MIGEIITDRPRLLRYQIGRLTAAKRLLDGGTGFVDATVYEVIEPFFGEGGIPAWASEEERKTLTNLQSEVVGKIGDIQRWIAQRKVDYTGAVFNYDSFRNTLETIAFLRTKNGSSQGLDDLTVTILSQFTGRTLNYTNHSRLFIKFYASFMPRSSGIADFATVKGLFDNLERIWVVDFETVPTRRVKEYWRDAFIAQFIKALQPLRSSEPAKSWISRLEDSQKLIRSLPVN